MIKVEARWGVVFVNPNHVVAIYADRGGEGCHLSLTTTIDEPLWLKESQEDVAEMVDSYFL